MLVLGTNIWYKSTHNNNIFFISIRRILDRSPHFSSSSARQHLMMNTQALGIFLRREYDDWLTFFIFAPPLFRASTTHRCSSGQVVTRRQNPQLSTRQSSHSSSWHLSEKPHFHRPPPSWRHWKVETRSEIPCSAGRRGNRT
jgi:hypothetical protein